MPAGAATASSSCKACNGLQANVSGSSRAPADKPQASAATAAQAGSITHRHAPVRQQRALRQACLTYNTACQRRSILHQGEQTPADERRPAKLQTPCCPTAHPPRQGSASARAVSVLQGDRGRAEESWDRIAEPPSCTHPQAVSPAPRGGESAEAAEAAGPPPHVGGNNAPDARRSDRCAAKR